MSNFKTLYLANNSQLDLLVYKEIVPFFKAKSSYESTSLSDENEFMEYEALSSNVKRIFRDLVYEQCNELECNRKEFIQLVNFLDFVGYNKVEFLPLYKRYIHNNRDDREFLRATAFIHRNKEYLGVNLKELYCIILGIDENSSLEDIKSIADSGNPDAIHIYARCLHYYGIGGQQDQKQARELYLKNWEENKDSDSLNSYAYCLEKGIGGERDEEKARELYLKNWEENKHSASLNNYAYCLYKGIGGERDEKRARELYLKNWEENKDSDGLNNYIICLRYGIRGERDVNQADRLQEIYNSLIQ